MKKDNFDQLLMQALTPTVSDEEIQVRFENKKENRRMKKMTFKKSAVVAACACLVVGTSVFASTRISSYQTGNYHKEYSKFEELTKVSKDAEFAMDVVEEFSNGYSFEGYNVVGTEGKDNDNSTVKSFKEVYVNYATEDGKVITLTAMAEENYDSSYDVAPDAATVIDGIDVAYTVYQNKIVPEGYEYTEEDKELLATGKFWIACDGSDEISETEETFVTWTKDGIVYSLFGSDLSESQDELLDMAKQIIESDK